MEDLSHWDNTMEFTGGEAAALIAGVDPAAPGAPLHKAAPALKQLREGHRIARAFVTAAPMTPDEFRLRRNHPSWAVGLMSVLFDGYPMLYKEPWPGDPDRPFELPRRFEGVDGDFDQQDFDRAEIHRWLGVVGLPSKYRFVRERTMESQTASIGPTDTPTSAEGGRVVKVSGEQRRHVMEPWIEKAEAMSSNKGDGVEVFSNLKAMAERNEGPMRGSTEDGVKYLNHKDEVRSYSIKMLRDRNRRRDRAR